MKKWLALGMTLLFLLSAGMAVAVAHQWPGSNRLEAANLRYTRAEWEGDWSISPADLKEIQRAHDKAIGIPVTHWPDHYSQYRLELDYTEGTEILYISWDHQVYCPVEQEVYTELGTAWLPYTKALDASFFGAEIPWSTVNELWPRKTKALGGCCKRRSLQAVQGRTWGLTGRIRT